MHLSTFLSKLLKRSSLWLLDQQNMLIAGAYFYSHVTYQYFKINNKS